MKLINKIHNLIHRKRSSVPDEPDNKISREQPTDDDSDFEMDIYFCDVKSRTPKKFQIIEKEIAVTENGSKILTVKIEISDIEEDDI